MVQITEAKEAAEGLATCVTVVAANVVVSANIVAVAVAASAAVPRAT